MGPDPRCPGSVRSRLSSVKLSNDVFFSPVKNHRGWTKILWIQRNSLGWLLVLTVGWCFRWDISWDYQQWNYGLLSTQRKYTICYHLSLFPPMAAWLCSDLTAERRMILHHQKLKLEILFFWIDCINCTHEWYNCTCIHNWQMSLLNDSPCIHI